ncbi:MAG: diaminopimelate epimerase [Saprospirales bacterium]|nr:diaminopimelate epimerase [Saprospirales bacterium]
MDFWKYQGAGNDFVLMDQRSRKWLDRSDTEIIKQLCDRHFGIGADGLILLQTHARYDFEMVYFNADGRESSMCGNGGRCIVAFARDLGIQRAKYRFWAIDGEHEATFAAGIRAETRWVELKMTDVPQMDAAAAEQAATAFVLNTGSPHYVRFVPDLSQYNIVQEGRAVRYSERFCETGINVNLVQAFPDYLAIRTYERGVEDETLACGTGVTAAALAYHRQSGRTPGQSSIDIQALGGALRVRYTAHSDGSFSDIWLCGPAKRVFSGNIEMN